MTEQTTPIPQINILDVPIHAQTFNTAVTTLATWATEGKRYVCTCPVYTLMLCAENPHLRAAILSADMVAADGMPLVWVQRLWGFPQAERIYGPDVLLSLCQHTHKHAISHYFLGGLPGVANQLADTLLNQFPGLAIAGTHTPPLAEVGSAPDWALIEHLNSAQPHIIWVGLGSPKQDIWMHLHRPYLNAPLLIGVGAAFDFISGHKPQAPIWMRKQGLEWMFRLAHEPRRLWRRYLLYNPRFVIRVLRQHAREHLTGSTRMC